VFAKLFLEDRPLKLRCRHFLVVLCPRLPQQVSGAFEYRHIFVYSPSTCHLTLGQRCALTSQLANEVSLRASGVRVIGGLVVRVVDGFVVVLLPLMDLEVIVLPLMDLEVIILAWFVRCAGKSCCESDFVSELVLPHLWPRIPPRARVFDVLITIATPAGALV
jgi:hypothetical protein